MSKLSSKTNAFFYRHRNFGIPNLMLYIGIANVVIYVLYLINSTNPLFYDILCYDHSGIFQRIEVWRLFTYPLVFLTEYATGSAFGVFWGVIGLLFYFYCGKVIEACWGVLRFNLYYLTGILLLDLGAFLTSLLGDNSVNANISYLNLTLFLAVATLQPEAMVRVYFIIPVKMKWLSWLYFGLTLYGMIRGLIQMIALKAQYGRLYLGWLLPVFALANYFLFLGKQFPNILPDFMQHPKNRAQRKTAQQYRASTQQYRPAAQQTRTAAQTHGAVHTVQPYRFRCTVCGRTDVSDPKLEFRYCSRCAGYRCYCMDHINNHAHITE